MSRFHPHGSWPFLLLCSFGLLGCGGPQIPANPPSLCFMEAPQFEDGSGERNPRASEWAGLLLGADSDSVLNSTAPGQDCTGQRIAWPTGEECGREEGTASASTLTEESVVVRQVDANTRLVWVMTHGYGGEDAEALGPVALVERTPAIGELRPEGWVVRAMGMLRNRAAGVTMRLRGSGDDRLLVAEGQTCANPDDEDSCTRSARIMPIAAGRFMPAPVYTEDGTCVGPATVYTNRYSNATLESGWSRRFHLTGSFQHSGTTLTITESVTATDTSPDHPAVPARRFRLVDAQRSISLDDGRLIAQGTPVWPRMLRYDGTTQIHEEDENTDSAE